MVYLLSRDKLLLQVQHNAAQTVDFNKLKQIVAKCYQDAASLHIKIKSFTKYQQASMDFSLTLPVSKILYFMPREHSQGVFKYNLDKKQPIAPSQLKTVDNGLADDARLVQWGESLLIFGRKHTVLSCVQIVKSGHQFNQQIKSMLSDSKTSKV